MKLTPQQQTIINYLADGRWHCMASPDFFMKDDRKRISELNGMGFEIIGFKCDKRCGVNHSSRVQMRKLKARPDGVVVSIGGVVPVIFPDGTRGVRELV